MEKSAGKDVVRIDDDDVELSEHDFEFCESPTVPRITSDAYYDVNTGNIHSGTGPRLYPPYVPPTIEPRPGL